MKLDRQYVMVFDPVKSVRRKKTVEATISTFEGMDENDNPRYSSWRANFVGDAYKPALELDNRTKIIITQGKVENVYHKELRKSFVTVTIFDFAAKEDSESKEDFGSEEDFESEEK